MLDKDPNNLSAIDGLASIVYQMAGQPFDPKRFEASKKYHQMHIAMKPDDPRPIIPLALSTGHWRIVATQNFARNIIGTT